MPFSQIRTDLLSLYGSARPPVAERAIQEFEVRHSVALPEEVCVAYSLMDGADHATDPYSSWIRFWPIEEWKLANDSLPAATATEDKDRLFLFADYGIDCVYYAIDLKPMSSSFGSVCALGATRVTQVASSFSKFVEMVLSDSDELHSYS
jgi:cell wall assembly regulator SMI1